MTFPSAMVLSAGTIQSVPFYERLDAAKNAGFDGISIFAAEAASLGEPLETVRQRIDDAGLSVFETEFIGNWLPGNPGREMPGGLAQVLEMTTPDLVLDVAAALGSPCVSVGDLYARDCGRDAIVDAFGALCENAATRDIAVALEFVPVGAVPDLAAAADIVRAAGQGNGGIMIDAWHFFRSGSDLADLAAMDPALISRVQIGDGPALPEPDLDFAMSNARKFPGEGEMDLPGFVAALRDCGFDGPLSVEIFAAELASMSGTGIAEKSMRTTRSITSGTAA